MSSSTQLTVAELKSRVKAHGAQIPSHVVEKADLQAFLDELESAKRAEVTKTLARQALPARELRVPELRIRMSELGLEAPSFPLEKQELVQLVEEAEKALLEEDRRPSIPKHLPSVAEIPKPWFQKESRSQPGCFYYVNAVTGECSWDLPAQDDSINASVEIATDRGPDPVPGKHDYRDDAFADDIKDASGDVAWSREDNLECSFGTGGVNALTISPARVTRSCSVATVGGGVSDKAIEGECFTWVRGETIGRGALGRVFKALDQHTGKIIAVKEVLINSNDDEDNMFRVELENEVDILKNLRHVHIVAYLGHDFVDDCLYLYLEHMSGGTVTQALQQFGAFEESLMADYCKQVLGGLEYLHTRTPPVIHRDIKGSNILLGIDCKAKLADFGCSKRAAQTLTHTMRGSVPWMAPEVVKHSKYGRAADIWSFGCFVIEMGTAAVPWGRFDNQMAALVRIGMSKHLPKLPDKISETCQEFILQCILREAAERPSATELLNHEFIKDLLPSPSSDW